METGKIAILFNNDAIDSSREEHKHVKEVLDNVLDVSQTVHQETTKRALLKRSPRLPTS